MCFLVTLFFTFHVMFLRRDVSLIMNLNSYNILQINSHFFKQVCMLKIEDVYTFAKLFLTSFADWSELTPSSSCPVRCFHPHSGVTPNKPLSIFLLLQNPTRLFPKDLRYAVMCFRDNPSYHLYVSRMLCYGHTACSYCLRATAVWSGSLYFSSRPFLRLYILKSV